MTTTTHRHAAGTASIALAVAALVALAVATGAARASGHQQFVGVVYPFSDRCPLAHDRGNCLSTEDLERLQLAHVSNARWGFSWSQVEPAKGTFHWRAPDGVIGALASRGIRVLPVLRGTPSWAGPTPETPPLRGAVARREWRRFLTAAVERYGRGGAFWSGPYPAAHPTAPAEPIKVWQVWNEQNIRNSWMHVRPRRYARLLRISHRAIRAGDRRAKILLGGMPGYVRSRAWRYLNNLYHRRGLKRDFDGVALHPYSPDVRHVFVQIRRMRHVMRRHHDGHTPLWISELGWGSGKPDIHGINQGLIGQKRLLRRTFTRLRRERGRLHLKRAYWFSWRDPQRPWLQCSFCGSAGLFRFNQQPKPAWWTFRTITTRGR